jgi:hypothetical protein
MVKPISSKRDKKNVTVEQWRSDKEAAKFKNPAHRPKAAPKKKAVFDVNLRHTYVKHNIKMKKIDISLIRKFDE